MHRAALIMSLVLGLSGCVSQSLFPTSGPLEETQLSGKGEAKVLIVDISGLLLSSRPTGVIDRLLNRPSLPTRFKEELTKAADDPDVKAVVLRINSPGGTVTASDILHHEVRVFKKKRPMPIIASIMDLGTSGGYYVAVAGDRIVAHPSSITGSIGVIMVSLNAAGLLEKVGIEAIAVTSGPNKDMGSPFRAMTEEERAIFQSVIDSLYDRFLQAVQEGRPRLSKEEVKRLADGRIYSAAQAKQLGLVDEIGYLDDAIELAKREAGLADARVVMYHRPSGYHPNMYSQWPRGETGWPVLNLDPISLTSLLGGGSPAFMYLWIP